MVSNRFKQLPRAKGRIATVQWQFTPCPLERLASVASKVRAVCTLAYTNPDCSRLVVVRHRDRGWDIPGGHRELGEPLKAALARELAEEAQARVLRTVPIRLLQAKHLPQQTHLFVLIYKSLVALSKFIPSAEIKARQLVSPNAFKQLYFGDKQLLEDLYVAGSEAGFGEGSTDKGKLAVHL